MRQLVSSCYLECVQFIQDVTKLELKTSDKVEEK
jgi:hypothetical protein